MDIFGASKLAEGIGTLAGNIMKGFDDLFTSDEERLNAQQKIMKVLQEPHNMQAMMTLQESQSPSKFKSGWRPALGWICVVGLGLHFLVFPLAEAVLRYYLVEFVRPEIDASTLMTLVLTLLGLGGMRTYEKFKGLTR